MDKVLVIVPFAFGDEGIENRQAQTNDVRLGPLDRRDAHPENLLGGKEKDVLPMLRYMGMRCIEEDGAEVICIGSTTTHQAVPYLRKALPVPVINPDPLSYKLAEMRVALGLSHRRKAYRRPDEPQLDMLTAMMKRPP